MTELRHTETNAGDDSAGRVFGLDGNLYLPVLLTVLGALALFAILALVLQIKPALAGIIVAIPLTSVTMWVVCLKQGRPAGYDRDLLEHWLGGGNFTRTSAGQERLMG
jgi:4-hydroxybenzoate polyprenyltransferase